MRVRKAKMSAEALVILIFIIIGFVIFVVFYFMLEPDERIGRETCHQSVVYRATLPSALGFKEYVPLKCKTQKVCITAGLIGGECDEFENAEDVETVRVSNEEDISEIISDHIVSCWSDMGHGKVSVFSQWLAQEYGIGEVYPTCSICSRIAFDAERLEKKGIDLSKVDVMEHMTSSYVPGEDISYYEYLIGKSGEIIMGDLFENVDPEKAEESLEELKELVKGDPEDVKEVSNITADDFEIEIIEDDEIEEMNKRPDEIAVVFMQISAPSGKEIFEKTMSAALSFFAIGFIDKPGAFVTTTTKAPAYAVADSAGKYRFVKGTIVDGKKVGGQFAKGIKTHTSTTFAKVVVAAAIIGLGIQQANVAHNRAIAAGRCGDLSYGGDSREGCSFVRTVNYNKEEISQYCSIIESID